MPKWRFWERPAHPSTPAPATAPNRPPRRTAPAGEIIQPESVSSTAAPDPQRLATLRRRRAALLFDVEQSELAALPDNPWRERMALLTETMGQVQAELTGLTAPTFDRPSFPPTPVTIDEVRWEDPADVVFAVGDEHFSYVSEVDWAERGTYVSRNELTRQNGEPANLVPRSFPPGLRDLAAERLAEALFIFASDLRRRAESDEALPDGVTLDAVIGICPVNGDWMAWGGYCPSCTALAQQRQALGDEVRRIGSEIQAEEEERAKLADRLPVARRRLAETDSEIARLEQAG
jgi:hypothetical protein